MANVYFFTGFPGFIASALIKKIVKEGHKIDQIYLLVLPSMLEKAKQEVDKIVIEYKVNRNIFNFIVGDITKKNLGISQNVNKPLQQSVTHVFHLAAIYDLAVPKNLAYNVNVNGTRFVNEWVQEITTLKRYIYFSTAYVSGTREGRILETELDMKQSFKNHYESTKFEAELLVRKIMNKIPTTIIRPGIVKGDSKTGETIKFDGPYFLLNFFDKLRFLPFIPYLGLGEAEGNFVPVDYIIDATVYLAHFKEAEGKTYHLTDPKPYKMKDIYRMTMEAYLGRKPIGMIPLSFAKAMLSLSFIRKRLRVEKEALDYFTYKSVYDSTQTQKDLEGTGISCSDYKDTLKMMISFYERYKDDETKQLKIR
ncbi:3-beta hydroxysteroid dehydrogenase [Vulcanibacillus modesticaldus]|uniref:3-beta hydroxysteroid dehydrogenase n=1 Tax=Vulcanibacillus modesticaldus TaxID=337097 RepID=A0A1D2YW30_9BACI|nr:SDR family oxidoreductase [Vulcanibacillus modesticaldus]OEF99899.1 3-beta hydroxysteroid dehydrogenase [Vulcanibacillus modesticaldus]